MSQQEYDDQLKQGNYLQLDGDKPERVISLDAPTKSGLPVGGLIAHDANQDHPLDPKNRDVSPYDDGEGPRYLGVYGDRHKSQEINAGVARRQVLNPYNAHKVSIPAFHDIAQAHTRDIEFDGQKIGDMDDHTLRSWQKKLGNNEYQQELNRYSQAKDQGVPTPRIVGMDHQKLVARQAAIELALKARGIQQSINPPPATQTQLDTAGYEPPEPKTLVPFRK